MNHVTRGDRTWLITGGSGFIGTNLIDSLVKNGERVRNVDAARPQIDHHVPLWNQLDINDKASLERLISDSSPDIIVHLAAKANLGDPLDDLMRVNVDGTKNVLDCALKANVGRLILTSTQYVNGPSKPYHDDLIHHTVGDYSKSKAEMEKLVRRPDYERLDWVVIRPTNIWGPYHPRFPTQLWKYMKSGLYLHPMGPPVVRSYGYVGNIIKQIQILANAPSARVSHRVFYVSDPPIDSAVILDAMSLSLRGEPVRRVPRWILRAMAYAGDIAGLAGVRAPMSSDRYERMTTEHSSREEEIWKEYGYSQTSLDEGIRDTTAWLRRSYPDVYSA
jgi:nucleoside-diphosphate-sugar epimerase